MSTTFGIKIPLSEELKPVARRMGVKKGTGLNGSNLKVWFTDPTAHLLDDDTEVIAMDNSQQGINTIGDIKKLIE